jgi:hypothetical protein
MVPSEELMDGRTCRRRRKREAEEEKSQRLRRRATGKREAKG